MSNDKITLTVHGNLTADPELRFTPKGAGVANFVVASTPRVWDKQANEWRDGTPSFLRVSVWNEQAENVAESLRRGSRVSVTGTLEQQNWEDKETGQKRSGFELRAEEVAASLRYARVRIAKMTRQQEPGAPAQDHGE